MRSAGLAGLVLLAGCNQAVTERSVEASSEVPAATATQASKAPAEPTSTMVPPTIFVRPRHAFGTEPFWSFRIGANTLQYSTPEVRYLELPMQSEQKDGVWRFTAVLQGKPMTLKIEPGECNDGMSDNTYMFKAEFTWDGKTERGCAKPN